MRDRTQFPVSCEHCGSILNLPQVRQLLSSEHFSVDGTLIEAGASMKGFVPKDGGRWLPRSAPLACRKEAEFMRATSTH